MADKLKRVGKDYAFELESVGTKIFSVDKSTLKKITCAGVTKKGFQCSRLAAFGKRYCFQHQSNSSVITTTSKRKLVGNAFKELVTKKELGQFYSINCDYILQGMYLLKGVQAIIEPFGGCGFLLNWVYERTNIAVESYDIMPKASGIIQRDVFKNIPVYKNKFVITNPPYLSKNKAESKEVFNLYKTDDLYKCLIIQLTADVCSGGILIVPLNFFCSFRKKDLFLRKKFLGLYDIILINVFEEPVFPDTSYTVCSFMFKKKTGFLETETQTKICIYPLKVKFYAVFNSKNFYCFGGSIFNLVKSNVFTIKRVTRLNCFSENATNIVVQCIDNKRKKINAAIVTTKAIYRDNIKKESARGYLSLWVRPRISLKLQERLVILFNSFINEKRKEFFSLFLSQYREFDRKRIPFSLVYNIFSHLIKKHVEDENK